MSRKVLVPEIGQIFVQVNDGDPWGKEPTRVKILDVKEGWVRYYMNDIFPDCRAKIAPFVEIYELDDSNLS